MPSLVLSSTLHDPDGSLLFALEKAMPVIENNYKKWIVAATKATDKKIIDFLEKNGVKVIFQENKLSKDPIEDNHLVAIDSGSKFLFEGERLQYTDGDRMIFGAAYFPDEIKKVAKRVTDDPAEYISITRSGDDNHDHHDALALTEQIFTRAYQKAIGKKIDPASTAHVFSKKGCEFLLENTNKKDIMEFPHGKWAILMKEGNFNIDCIESSGILSFETPLQFNNKLTMDAFIDGNFLPDLAGELREARKNNKLPPLEALRKYYRYTIECEDQASEDEWTRRLNLANEWINFLNKEIKNMHLSEKEIENMQEIIKEERLELKGLEKFKVAEKDKEINFKIR